MLLISWLLTLSLNAHCADKIDDGSLIGVLAQIEQELIKYEHTDSELSAANNHLQQALQLLQGRGSAVLVISDGPTFSFGTAAVGGSVDKIFVVTNVGTVPALEVSYGGLAAPFLWKGVAAPGTGGTCGSSLQAAASCTLVLSYMPTSVSTNNDVLEVEYNNGFTRSLATRDVTGTGVTPAMLSISNGATLDFGDVLVGSFSSRVVTITNSGMFPASVIGARVPLPFAFDENLNGPGECGRTLVSGGSCRVTLMFSPRTRGASSASFEMTYYNGASNQVSTRGLTGNGIR